MSLVFETIDKTARRIHLSTERWKHIAQEHPEIYKYLEEIKNTLKNPDKITKYSINENIRYYYRQINKKKQHSRFLLVVVKYLNKHGFIITTYSVRAIK